MGQAAVAMLFGKAEAARVAPRWISDADGGSRRSPMPVYDEHVHGRGLERHTDTVATAIEVVGKLGAGGILVNDRGGELLSTAPTWT